MTLADQKTAIEQLRGNAQYTKDEQLSISPEIFTVREYCGRLDDRAAEWSGDAIAELPGDPGAVDDSVTSIKSAASALEGIETACRTEAAAISGSMDAKAGARSALELEALASLAGLEAEGLRVLAKGLDEYSGSLTSAQSLHSGAVTELASVRSAVSTMERPPAGVLDDPAWDGSRLLGVVQDVAGILGDAIAAADDMLQAINDVVAAERQLGYAYSDAAGYRRLSDFDPAQGVSVVEAMLALVHNVDDPDEAVVSQAEWKSYLDERAALSPEERAKLDELLANARTPEERQILISALATGAGLEATAKLAEKLSTMTSDEVGNVANLGLGGPNEVQMKTSEGTRMKQFSNTTCGTTSLLMLAAQRDPFLALYLDSGTLVDGYRPPFIADLNIWEGKNDTLHMTAEQRLDHVQTQLRIRANEWTFWPGEYLGTAPWGTGDELERALGTDVNMQYSLVGPYENPQSLVDQTVASVDRGEPVLLLVGDGNLPRHYVLVVSHDAGVLTVYEPSGGATYTISAEDMAAGGSGQGAYGGWSELYGAGVPAK